jgi:hypothetical protein
MNRETMSASEAPENREAQSRAWYASAIEEFLEENPATIVGSLALKSDFPILPPQRDAWLGQIQLLQEQLAGISGSIYFEFNIPRMGRRIDTVLIAGPVVFAIEFKVGESVFDRSAIDQVWDYALDLKNFHEASHNATIVPILVATAADSSPAVDLRRDADGVYRPISVHCAIIGQTIGDILRKLTGEAVNAQEWARAPYRPTPTIIEAARSLYAQHSVEAISTFDAGKQNLRITSRRLEQLVDDARVRQRKAIAIVTGVPGAGKTLVGLNIATRRRDEREPTHAVLLSGNGPLVAVLREALTRDEVLRRKAQGEKVRKGKVEGSVKAFIQNVHHFRDDLLKHPKAPSEHVVIFDEAQRAWDAKETASFMLRKKKRPGFTQSEPEFLISGMDRHLDWAVVICLVGGGQEINRGEAGIDSWIDAINSRFSGWDLHISTRLTDPEYGAGRILKAVESRPGTHFDDSLHLAAAVRSFRAENMSAFVQALLRCDPGVAEVEYGRLAARYPIAITRDLRNAKNWIRSRARGTERFGVVASSQAHRLKPESIDIRAKVNPVHWFLNDRDDTRSSYYLEDAATEFQVQGLELDWTCVAWDADFRFAGSDWNYHSFSGDRWDKIRKIENQRYLCNAYRVLLTRARQGMVIYVPAGDPQDPTRPPAYYDSTYQYLKGIGLPEVK